MSVSNFPTKTVSSHVSLNKMYQVSIREGMDHFCQSDIRHFNYKILEMEIADFLLQEYH